MTQRKGPKPKKNRSALQKWINKVELTVWSKLMLSTNLKSNKFTTPNHLRSKIKIKLKIEMTKRVSAAKCFKPKTKPSRLEASESMMCKT